MQKFLQKILKKGSTILTVEEQQEENVRPKIGNPKITINNSCYTLFEGNYIIPEGTVATVEASIVAGFEGSGTPGNNGLLMFLGTKTVQPGLHPYTVNLGNSGQNKVISSFRMDITLNNGEKKSILVQRGDSLSSFYDTAPC